ncbi:hypothetical protein GCM10022279_31770 [Comamonas faecalis]|uniref:HAMP domain-containing protein n=1 Tax=Comamonas faecalis TaxID=1387849 RepID=A0ABP7S1V5_9BURK
MRINHWSVGRKLWGLVLLLVVGMVLAMELLLTQLQSLNDEATQASQLTQERAQLATQWHGMVALDAERAVIQISTFDDTLAKRVERDSEGSTKSINALQQQVTSMVSSSEGKELLEKIGVTRTQALNVIKEAETLRVQGDELAASALVDSKLRPAIKNYLDELASFVTLQNQLRDAMQQEVEQRYQTALWLGRGGFAVFVAFVLWLSWLLVRSITQPLARAVGLADAIAAGDLTQDVHDERGDELGRLLRSLSAMGGKLRQVVSEVRSGVESVTFLQERRPSFLRMPL